MLRRRRSASGARGSFAVLAGAGITNTGPTTINGDLGTFPTTSITGAASMTVTGTNHGGDAVTQGAKTDLVTAYNTATGEGPTTAVAADLGGRTLTAGIYNSASSLGLTGALTLNGAGNPNALFVFQAGSTLTTASASSVVLTNGAQACNVFWQVGSSATLGTGSSFRRDHHGADVDHGDAWHDHRRPGVGPQRRRHPRHRHHHDPDVHDPDGHHRDHPRQRQRQCEVAQSQRNDLHRDAQTPGGTGTGTPGGTGTPTGTTATGTLPFTGINPLLPVLGAVLVGSGLLLMGLSNARRRRTTA